MAVLNDCLSKGDYEGAVRVIEEIKNTSNPIITDNIINMGANAFSDENNKSVQNALAETGTPPGQTAPMPTPAPQESAPYNAVVPHQQNIKQTGNSTAPMPRPAVTPFNDI